ncbi:uncharacterized protein EDB91DRAFT_1268746 [Suillus paluster]|uniref:uncharacterized protein n=1 Tax=Suillus paluster TaxID=48578 RepID=UPI001B8763BD|nr:uncharacterized protein EDB91DRAFT_1268746 [Suillus paluster]KAG1745953.1 hypothetical protein EDB91DRAFT_1268746 [Suillus paluster]
MVTPSTPLPTPLMRLQMASSATTTPNTISLRPVLSSFAVQIVKYKFVADIKHAVRPGNGLYISFTPSEFRNASDWDDIGSLTVIKVEEILRKEHPLSMALLEAIAADPQRKRRGQVTLRQIRPVKLYTDFHATGSPKARRIHKIALSVPYDLFVYNSRIGQSSSYSAIYRALQMLCLREENQTRLLGQNLTKRGVLVIDNVQNYLRQCDSRICRSNVMNVGLAGTYIELEDIDVLAFDMTAKSRLLDENKRMTTNVEGK